MFNDDDTDERDGPDTFVMDAVVSKVNERRIFMHAEFEQVCSRYWQLLHSQPGANRSSDVISKDQYCALMKRVYKVLLPLYRAEEMNREVAQEWIHDARGQKEMNLALFQKTLFRIAHGWATHIDIDEYIELLSKIYDRITIKKVIRGDTGKEEIALPRIQVEIFQEREEEEGAEWESINSDMYQDENYEYKEEQDADDPSLTKKYKRPIADGVNEEDGTVMMSVRDPFLFKEEVQYYREPAEGKFDDVVEQPSETDVTVDLLADLDDIFPMGYPTEQFICKLKNDVIAAFIKLKEDRKKAVAEMRRQMFEDGSKVKVERPPEIQRDPGLLDAQGFTHEEFFKLMSTTKQVRIPTLLRVQDRVYNQMRQLFKDINEIAIRPFFAHPSAQLIKGQANHKIYGSNDPSTHINENKYNPALERRLIYKNMVCEMGEAPKNYCLNVNYLVSDPMYESAFRSDVNRIETSGKMSIKPREEGDIVQDHEFCNVTTNFQKTVQIMLSFKFSTFWTAKATNSQSQNEKDRDLKVYQYQENLKLAARNNAPLSDKNLTENFDETNNLKVTRGPFYQLDSRGKSIEDDFVNCTTKDLIDAANESLYRILLIGKPRTGKTTLAKALAEKLDLVRISPEVWLEDLFARIKDREENPPEDEEEEEEENKEEENKEEEEEEPELDEEGNPIPKAPKEEVPVEPEEPKRDKKDLWLSDLEYEVRNTMRDGKAISKEQLTDIIKEMVVSPAVQTKGFILDLTFGHGSDGPTIWGKVLSEDDILTKANQPTHIIELLAEDDEVRRRARGLRVHPMSGDVYSAWERKERNKPKPVVLDENGEPIEDEEEPEENEEELLALGKKGPLVDSEMVTRCCDSMDVFNREIFNYNDEERSHFSHYEHDQYDSSYVKVDISGMQPDELTASVLAKLRPRSELPLRPIAHIIEDGAGSFKELLTVGMDDEEGFFLPRQWSLWKTTDPVALSKGQVEQGVPEWAAHFGNNVFVFKDEDNMKAFVKEPRRYISEAPKMPERFRLMMLGPRGIGVRTQAAKLESLYNWPVIDFKAIVQNKLREILSMPAKPPNNVTGEGPCMVSLSEQELADIKEGKPFPSWKFLPWIVEHLNYQLRVKDPPPPEEDSQTEDEWDETRLKQHKDKIKKKKKEAELKAKAEAEAAEAKAKRAQQRKEALDQGLNLEDLGLQESEEEIIIEDVSIERLVLQEDEDGTTPTVDQFIMIGFPLTETHCQKLKDFNIEFDRILFLSEEDNEEEPGKEVAARMTELDGVQYEWAAEKEIADGVAAVLKEWLGEEGEGKMMEIKDCTGAPDEVFFKIRSRLDPFFVRPDDTVDDIRTSQDYEEEDIYRMPRSDFGDFCPVTYVDDGFLVKGGSDEDGGENCELYVNGKRYFFAGTAEMEKFRKNPQRYMIVQTQGAKLPLQPPAPKIMITGNKCAGITAQINLLCEKFKLDSLELMNLFNQEQTSQLKARQRKRLLERGFKGIPEPDDPADEPEVDTEIVEDPEDFDKGEQDVKDLKAVIPAAKGLIIDGNWRPEGEDAEYQLPDLLKNARRMPEVVIILKCKEEVSISRNLADCADDLKAEFERKMEEREENKKKAREEARAEKLQELEEGDYDEMTPEEIEAKKKEEMQAWDEAREEQEIEEDDNDDEKPDLDRMKEEQADKIKAVCEADEANLETLKTKLTEDWKAVEVLELDTSKISADFVHIKLLDMLKNHIKFRRDLIERAQAIQVKPDEVPVYEKSYTYKHSKFGVCSPITPFRTDRNKSHAVLYRERLFFLSDKDEQAQFMLEPSKYVLGVEAVPQDIKFTPKVVVQGLPKSGKTELCQKIAAATGAVHLQIESLIESIVDRDSSFAGKISEKLREQGRDLDDLSLVQLIQKRVEQADCIRQGWVLEGFPDTRAQAILMARKSLQPSNVIICNIPMETVYKRTESKKDEEFSCNRVVLKRRLDFMQKNLPQMVYFYQKFYNSVTSIDGLKSKWFMEDVAVRAISSNLKARMTFARGYQHESTELEKPCAVQNLNMDRCYFKQSISQFGYYCPVSWRTEKKFISCAHFPEHVLLYKRFFYYFANEQARELFMKNPRKFTENVIFSQERNIPKRMASHKASEVADTEKALMNYCPVTLADEEKLVAGNPLLVINLKGEKFTFCTEEKLQKFLLTPSRYAKTKLPVKIPPEERPVQLYHLKTDENSIPFLEQALGSVVTKGLREIGEQRLKYPTLSVKETMLKLFAIFLKTENPANTEHMRQKYMTKMQTFLEKCTVPEELHELAEEKKIKKQKGKWPQFKEDYYNSCGQMYDKILHDVEKERAEGFMGYMR